MPVPLTNPALSRRRWPLGRVVAALALAGSVSAVTAVTASAATTSSDQISSVNVPKPVAEHGITGGDSMTVTVFFHILTKGTTTVTLKNFNKTEASMPAKLVVPAGTKNTTFTVTTKPVSTPTLVQIIANDSKVEAMETGVEFTVEPPGETCTVCSFL